jgi:ribose 5-phosphate isomerase B
MKIYLATDHAGYNLKEAVKAYLLAKEYEVKDCGAFSLEPTDDYPDYVSRAAEAVASDHHSMGVIFGGSGQGEAMDANRYGHVRCAVYYGGSLDIIRLSREHNDANMLSLGARFVSESEALKAVVLWLNTAFSDEARHKRRIDKMA